MKKKTKIILSVTIISVILLFTVMSYIIGNLIFNESTQLITNEDTIGVSATFWDKYGVDYDEFCNSYTVENIKIESTFDGHIIPADYIYANKLNADKNNNTAILVHGLGGNRYSNYPVAQTFLEQGYNVLTFDQRSTNENTAQYTTFGVWEKFDLIDYVNYVKTEAPDKKMGIWGTSFGGATAGLALGYEDTADKVDFLMLDCPVSSMKWMIEDQIRNMEIPISTSYMTWCGNIVNNLKLGFTYDDANVSKALSNIQIPVLIINSEVDTLTPYFMGKDIYDSIQSEDKVLWTSPDSEHTKIWLDYNLEYEAHMLELLKKIQ